MKNSKSRYNEIRKESAQWGFDGDELKELIQNIHAGNESFEVSNCLFVHCLAIDEIPDKGQSQYLNDFEDYHVFLTQ